MKFPLTPTILLAISCLIFSCKKDVHPNEGTILLKIKATFDNGTVSYRLYQRNASNNVTAIRDSITSDVTTEVFEYGSNGKASKVSFLNGQGSAIFSHEFEYNGIGQVTKRQTKPGFLDIADDYHLYIYDATGNLLTDSTFSRIDTTKPYELIAYSTFTYTGGNATEAASYAVLLGTTTLIAKTKFEYDNAINPFKNIPIAYYYNEANSSIWDIRYYSQNNVVKEYSADGNGAYHLDQTYSWKYNSSNYPWKVKSEIKTPGQGLNQSEYFYR